MSKALTLWIPLLADLKFCPNPLIKSEVLKACREFCEITRIWSEALTAINVVAGTAAYSLASTAGEVVAVERAEISGEAIWPTAASKLDQESSTWRTDTTSESGDYYVNEDRQIVLVTTPDTAITGGLAVWAWLKPLLTATDVKDWLWNDHQDLVAIGARGRLMMLEGCPWSDMQKGAALLQLFETKAGSVASKRDMMRSPARLRDILTARQNIDF
jgi:hypothetical protein